MKPFNEVPGLVDVGDSLVVNSVPDGSYGQLILTLDHAAGAPDCGGDWDLLDVLDVDVGQRIPFTADQIRALLPVLIALVKED